MPSYAVWKSRELFLTNMSDDSLVQNAFVAGLLTFPLVLCRLAFDYMVHVQFGMEADFTGSHVLTHTGPAVISVFALSMSTERFKKSKYAQFLYFAASVYIGCLVIYYSNEDGTFGVRTLTLH